MASLLIKNAFELLTMDDADSRWPDGGVYIEGNVVKQVGRTEWLPAQADEIIDARDLIVLPGLINTHHHFYQTLTRNVPDAQNVGLFDWLRVHYPIWSRLTPDAIYISAKMAMAELLLSGCTTSSDHTYIWPNGSRLDDQIAAAAEMGLRFHAARGSMSLGASQGGLPPDSVVEDEAAIIRDTRRVIEQYHDASRYAMVRVFPAPCTFFSVSQDLMRQSIELARAYGTHAHTHIAETMDEHDYCLKAFGRTPVELAEDLGWVGPDVWHAHMVHPSPAEAGRLGRTRTGIAHCPTSNMRLASGIAPIGAMRAAGARVGLGVDGSASNDGSHMLAEARQALLLHRVRGDPSALTAREVLHMATRGGAQVLGRDDVGYLAPGMAADLVGFRADTVSMAGGAVHDAAAALIFCQPATVDLNIVNGRIRVRDGELVDVDVPALVAHHNATARALARGELR